MLWIYRLLQLFLSPLLILMFVIRLLKNKEDKTRYPERLGFYKTLRPQGRLIHLHGASVGEALSLIPLIEKLHQHTHVLLTTGTVTSAHLIQKRLAHLKQDTFQFIHQFAPLDTYPTVHAFYHYWHPEQSIFTESDFWPELLSQSSRPMLINARISDRSFPKYQKLSWLFKPLIQRFTHILTQQQKDADRLKALGGHNIQVAGNLKFDATPLPINADALEELSNQIKNRPVLMFSSTHPQEEEQALFLHQTLQKSIPNLLTVIAPRHPHRGDDIKKMLSSLCVVKQRSQNDKITPDTQLYLADTLGELGTFYTLADAVIMGGSLIPHGGQNPLEPLRLNTSTFSGPYMHNFTDMLPFLEKHHLLTPSSNIDTLTQTMLSFFQEKQERQKLDLSALKGPTEIAAHLILK